MRQEVQYLLLLLLFALITMSCGREVTLSEIESEARDLARSPYRPPTAEESEGGEAAVVAATMPACPLAGDYDGNRFVDGNDYLIWQREFGNGVGSPADGNQDGSVDAADYVVWRNHFGQSCEPLPTTLVESIDRLVRQYPSPTMDNFKVFSSYASTSCNLDMTAAWNPNFWGASVNLSPVAWHDDARWGDPQVCGPTLGHGIAITKRHVITHHQHGTESPGWSLQFVRRNGEILTRKTAWEYEVDASTYWRILWLEEDLPDDMVAPMPTADSDIRGKPIANLNQFREMRLQWVNFQNQSTSWVPVNISADPDPIRRLYFRAPIGGDSGKPLFAIIGEEIVPLSVWWTTGGGSSIIFDQPKILEALDRLSDRKGDVRRLKPRLINVR